ncbi:LuxE/PaaK family acyltransferase [Robertkochia aurantiaca]|uniref:LuxE/PaaK family acyltransferase n=1 Tax=Robertkochia aurantiaca TaxID=2873700 RepID=UPI001CCBDFD6|nr:acyl transferase [Robertkochia sp. 3YJGBD-33]
MNVRAVFDISNKEEFRERALEVFNYQYDNVPVYREFCELLQTDRNAVKTLEEIPFLPIAFFKSKKIITSDTSAMQVFSSSGTTGTIPSKHYVANLGAYEQSFMKAFELFYGDPQDYNILALLPSYLEREGSSLIYMVAELIERSKKKISGFYLNELDELAALLRKVDAAGEKTLLIGVSFALLDLIESHSFELKNTLVMETGGMKGRRREMIREELHEALCNGFGIDAIHSEYGMTELLSQAYSKGNGIFHAPPWMQVLVRDTEDPLSYMENGRTGGINVIDLANVNSCSFIATQDLGKLHPGGGFEVLGRFDNSDIRGCNLMVL